MIGLSMYVLVVAFAIAIISVHFGAKTPDIVEALRWQVADCAAGVVTALAMYFLIFEGSPLTLVAMFTLVFIGWCYTSIDKNIRTLDRQRSPQAN